MFNPSLHCPSFISVPSCLLRWESFVLEIIYSKENMVVKKSFVELLMLLSTNGDKMFIRTRLPYFRHGDFSKISNPNLYTFHLPPPDLASAE